MYDYYQHRSGVNVGNRPQVESHTTTNRPVFGGNGIAPDETFIGEKFDSRKAALLDPIFFFVRENLDRETLNGSMRLRDQVRQSIIFGNPIPNQDELLRNFNEFTKSAKFKVSDEAMQKDIQFIAKRINYELALATFGTEAAKRVQIAADAEIEKAIGALPRAATLAETARIARNTRENKKARQVAFPTGQGRNRRN